MATYTTTKATLDEIAQRSEQNRKRLEQARATIAAAVSDLTAMQSAYSGFATQLNTDAAANPANDAWQVAKAEKDQLVADFQALKNEADALNTAVNS